MTAVHPNPSIAGRRDRMRRALRLDLRLNAEQLAGTMLLAVLALVLAGTLTDLLVWAAPAWAALSWYRYGRADDVERSALRAGLGLSRADALRGRLALVGIEGGVLVLVSAGGTALAAATGHDAMTSLVAFGSDSNGPYTPMLPSALVGALSTACVLVVTGLVVGRECTTRRPGVAMFALSLLSFGGAYLLVTLGSFAPMSLTLLGLAQLDLPFSTRVLAFAMLTVVVDAILLGVLLLLLRSRARAWIRSLDAAE